MAGKKAYRLFDNGTDTCLVSPVHLRRCAYTAKKGVGFTSSVSAFFLELESNVIELSKELREGIYEPRPFDVFIIRDPKPRLIQAADFRDRVVHHALCALIVPHLERSYLPTSYACQQGKGTHMAVYKAKELAGKYRWVGRLDVWHFFENIPHDRLMTAIRKRIGDRDVLRVLNTILQHGHSIAGRDRGLPIGNLTSQHFGNFYLDRLDHRIKEQFGVADFIRYMDDIVLFANDKAALKHQMAQIRDFVEQELGLKLKDKDTRLSPMVHGFPFLGFRIYPDQIRLTQTRRKRLKSKLKATMYLPEQEQIQILPSVINWAEMAQTRQLRRRWIRQGWLY